MSRGVDMRVAFRARGYSMKNYAVSRGLDYDLLRQVVTGVRIGSRRGKARECVIELFCDGILALEHPTYMSVREECESGDIARLIHG